ncbi:hypothetical protein DFJ73DRAFT_828919 [Zopfochytrium polystomum]|nr:hypothetical protein DFJ73DRAFT_828919 [Zopfochytrium polystomum]
MVALGVFALPFPCCGEFCASAKRMRARDPRTDARKARRPVQSARGLVVECLHLFRPFSGTFLLCTACVVRARFSEAKAARPPANNPGGSKIELFRNRKLRKREKSAEGRHSKGCSATTLQPTFTVKPIHNQQSINLSQAVFLNSMQPSHTRTCGANHGSMEFSPSALAHDAKTVGRWQVIFRPSDRQTDID